MSLVESSLIAMTDDPAVEDAATNTMLDVVKQHLDDETWTYHTAHQDEDRAVLKAGAKGENGSYNVAFDIREPKHLFQIFVVSHLNFPQTNRKDLAVYLTRANYGMTLGNFEMDMNDGEVRFRCATTIAGTFLTTQMVHAMLGASLGTMDRYFGNMVKVGYGIMSPEEAIKEIEGDRSNIMAALTAALSGTPVDSDKVSPTQ